MHSRLFFDQFEVSDQPLPASAKARPREMINGSVRSLADKLVKAEPEAPFKASERPAPPMLNAVVEAPDERPINREQAQPTRPANSEATHCEPATPSRQLDLARLRSNHIFLDAKDEQGKIATTAYKSLRTRVLHQLDERSINHFMVIGPSKDVGKTLTSINLAVMLAKHQSKRVILADLDLRAPSIHRVFGLSVTNGIAELAAGQSRLGETLVNPGIANLLLLPGNNRVEDSSELLMSGAMQTVLNMLQSLKNHIVIFDTPPVLGCDDVNALAPCMGGCLLVVREGHTSRPELQQTLAMVGESCPVLGVAINRSKELNFGHYYY